MPRRPREQRARPDAGRARSGAGGTRRGRGAGGDPKSGDGTSRTRAGEVSFVEDPLTGETAEMVRIQPYQATKTYICPGCNQEIRPGTAHVVIVPHSDPTDRRHWHTPCWEHRHRRRPTGR